MNIWPEVLEEGPSPTNVEPTLQIYGSYAMTGKEQDLLQQYLTQLNVLGEGGTNPNIDAWHQEVRYALGPNAPQSLEEASELRYEEIREARRPINRLC